jgi:hypothetical protein
MIERMMNIWMNKREWTINNWMNKRANDPSACVVLVWEWEGLPCDGLRVAPCPSIYRQGNACN